MDAIRPCRPGDGEACLAAFDGNTPPFFDPAERADFRAFLLGTSAAGLAGDMVARGLHRSGIGTRPLEARLRAIAGLPGIHRATLDTSQHTTDVYARFGFRPLGPTPDGHAPGRDRREVALDVSNTRSARSE